jgi:hypothetical protein
MTEETTSENTENQAAPAVNPEPAADPAKEPVADPAPAPAKDPAPSPAAAPPPRPPEDKGSKLDWPLIRKFESLIFASMVFAIPFFAFKVVDLTSTQLAVRQTGVDLVRDLVRAKDISKEYGLSITVCGRPATENEGTAYLIQNGNRTIEEVLLPKGVNVLGSVTFDESGTPTMPGANFTISKGWKSSHISLSREGIAAME